MNFICMRMKIHFHIKGWAPTLVLKQRRGELRNGLLNLIQELESVIHWPDGYTDMLIGLSPWTCWYSIFWWSLTRTPLGRETCVCHIIHPSAYGFAQNSSGVEIAVCQRPGGMALRMRQKLARPWVDVRVPIAVTFAITQIDTFWPFPVMGWFKSHNGHNGIHRNNGAIASGAESASDRVWYPRAILMRAPRKE